MSGTEERDRALWDAYRASPSEQTRNDLVVRYLGLVHFVARKFHRNSGGGDDALEELVSAGTFGLLQAVSSFDPDRGLQFSTFAIRRIQGAILDDLRARDWVPRSIRDTGRKVERARKALLARGAENPSAEELAREAGLEVKDIHRLRLAESQSVMKSLDDSTDDDGAPLSATVGSDALSALERVILSEESDLLQSMIEALPPRERTVLVLHYYEHLTLRQIAAILYVNETRVSQLHTSAKRRLRSQCAALLA